MVNWGVCFHSVHKIQDVHLNCFQMRMMHRIIGTHVIWKQMVVRTDGKCLLIITLTDDIEHIFRQCTVSHTMWTSFINVVNENCYTVNNMRLAQCLVISGNHDNIKNNSIFSFMLLLAKQYLYRCEIDSWQTAIVGFQTKLIYIVIE